jgi:hypothetical protein
MKKVYVAGMYSKSKDGGNAHVTELLSNIKRGIKMCAKLLNMGYAPFCPWLDFLYSLVSNHPISIDRYYEYSLAWLEVSDCVLLLDEEYPGNSGIVEEINRAKELDIPIFTSLTDMENWNGSGDR